MNGRFVNFLAVTAFSTFTMFGGTITVSNVAGGNGATETGPYTASLNSVSSTVVCDDDNDLVIPSWTANEISLSQLVQSPSTYLSETLLGPVLEAEVNNYNAINHTSYSAQTVATDIYEAVGYLVLSLVKLSPSSTQAIDTQYAIWDLMNDTSGNTTTVSSSNLYIDINTIEKTAGTTFNTSSVQSADAGASYAASAINAVLNNSVVTAGLEILAPANYSATCSGTAPNEKCTFAGTATQELWTVVATPEPATYALLGFGLILLSFGTFRRVRKNN
jgi:hypothetical protein